MNRKPLNFPLILEIFEQARPELNSTHQPKHARCHINKRWRGFSATNTTQGSEARLHPTEHPNAMPATERCPGQPETDWKLFHSACLRSPSVMDATMPAMSPTKIPVRLPAHKENAFAWPGSLKLQLFFNDDLPA